MYRQKHFISIFLAVMKFPVQNEGVHKTGYKVKLNFIIMEEGKNAIDQLK